MNSSKGKKVWWSKLKSSFSSKKENSRRKDGKDDSLRNKLNVNEEYMRVLRSKSYTEIWGKVQVQLDEKSSFSSSSSYSSSSPSSSNSSLLPFYMNLSDFVLEPCQEDVIDVIKSSNIETLLIDYFDASLEACNIYESLLRGLHKTRSNNQIIKRVLNLSQEKEKLHLSNYIDTQSHEIMLKDLASYASLINPLSHIIANGAVDFPMIHDKYSLLLQKLNSKRRKIKRKEKFTRFYKKAARYGFMITYIVLAIVLLALATHTTIGLLGTPGLLLPYSLSLIKKLRDNNGGSLKINLLKHLGSQLDVAAKGVYIFINDFDTIGRLVTRVHDEVQHKREIAAMCVRNGKNLDVIKEALRDIQMHEQGFDEQLQELEEHIYLCFVTINRSRRLVLQEILAPFNNF